MNDEFCSQHYDNCGFFGTGASDRFKLIEKESAEYHQVKKLLKSGWKHRKKNTPVVHAIYKVMWPLHMLDPYLKYR
ncbi:hypothetical protein BD410DRAFT_847334 [Rickenella mellea]|uniref:Uncharacterized protein n=1 Tax=Rickenella mellea TaxID=50990 RepID=A0A4Y7PFI3_9AGAM|nr:hypothetical protein BD410DRAFT_847334 [Rickenella mellea]